MKTYKVGDSFVHSIGNGKPVYVINGGPGLEYHYLQNFLLPLAETRQVIFYDQLGTGDSFDLSISTTSSALLAQLEALLHSDPRPKDILAHSWGSYLALSLFADNPRPHEIDKIIFMNPFALDYERYLKSGERLAARFPQEIMEQVGQLAEENTENSYLRMMNLIAPYYTHRPEEHYNFKFASYNSPMEDGVYSSIVGFNHAKLVEKIKSNLYVIKCDDDFISLEDTKELQDTAKKHTIIHDCGHFPFLEKKEETFGYLLEYLNA